MSSAGINLSFPTLAFHGTASVAEAQSDREGTRRLAHTAMVASELLMDGAAAALALQMGWAVASFARSQAAAYPQPGVIFTVAVAICIVAFLERIGAYRPAKSLLFVGETAMVLAVSSSAFLALAVLSATRMVALPMREVPVTSIILFLCLLIEKTSMHMMEQKLHERGTTSTKVALCGTGLACRRLYTTLINSPKLGLYPSVVVDPSASQSGPIVESGYSLKRSAEVLSEDLNCSTLRKAGVEKVLVIASSFGEYDLKRTLEAAASCNMPTEICAGDIATAPSSVEHQDIDGIVMVRPLQNNLLDVYKLTKRSFDAIASAILILLFGPIMLAVAAAIKRTSPGNVLFRQQRVGRGGQLFTILKFRSMHEHACGDGFSPTSGADSRISGVGRLLRKTSLDELPQLFNVLRGEMSLVGPRPEMPFIVEKYTPLESRRLAVTPGITGLWQISAHRKDLIHNNMQYDLYYVRHRGFFMDIAILFHTIGFAMRGH